VHIRVGGGHGTSSNNLELTYKNFFDESTQDGLRASVEMKKVLASICVLMMTDRQNEKFASVTYSVEVHAVDIVLIFYLHDLVGYNLDIL
jgi:hypothetical protein